jgi:hypothetical protein
MLRRVVLFLLFLVAVSFGSPAMAQCTVTNTFTNGTTADANQVNTNFSNILNCLTPGQLKGTSTNDNANAGNVGEYVSSTVTTPVSVASATATNITTISLTAGDWDVSGCIMTAPGGGPSTTIVHGWVSLTSATLPSFNDPNRGGRAYMEFTPANSNPGMQLCTAPFRVSIATTTTVYLSGFAVFSSASMGFNGFIEARRAR